MCKNVTITLRFKKKLLNDVENYYSVNLIFHHKIVLFTAHNYDLCVLTRLFMTYQLALCSFMISIVSQFLTRLLFSMFH